MFGSIEATNRAALRRKSLRHERGLAIKPLTPRHLAPSDDGGLLQKQPRRLGFTAVAAVFTAVKGKIFLISKIIIKYQPTGVDP